MRRLVLVGCGKAKRPTPCAAKDLYIGNLFAAQLTLAKHYSADVFILSAKYGLLRLHDIVAPYELKLTDLPRAERAAWAERVAREVDAMIEDTTTVTILASEAYAAIGPLLRTPYVETPLKGLSMGQRLRFISQTTNPRKVSDAK